MKSQYSSSQKIVLLLGLLHAGIAFSKCEEPVPPPVPDGNTASNEEMVEAYRAVHEFQVKGSEYMDCLGKQNAMDPTADLEVKYQRLMTFNKFAGKMKSLNDNFDKQLQLRKKD